MWHVAKAEAERKAKANARFAIAVRPVRGTSLRTRATAHGFHTATWTQTDWRTGGLSQRTLDPWTVVAVVVVVAETVATAVAGPEVCVCH